MPPTCAVASQAAFRVGQQVQQGVADGVRTAKVRAEVTRRIVELGRAGKARHAARPRESGQRACKCRRGKSASGCSSVRRLEPEAPPPRVLGLHSRARYARKHLRSHDIWRKALSACDCDCEPLCLASASLGSQHARLSLVPS